MEKGSDSSRGGEIFLSAWPHNSLRVARGVDVCGTSLYHELYISGGTNFLAWLYVQDKRYELDKMVENRCPLLSAMSVGVYVRGLQFVLYSLTAYCNILKCVRNSIPSICQSSSCHSPLPRFLAYFSILLLLCCSQLTALFLSCHIRTILNWLGKHHSLLSEFIF